MKDLVQYQFDKNQAQARRLELVRLLLDVLGANGIKLELSRATLDAVLEVVDEHEVTKTDGGCEVSCYNRLVELCKKFAEDGEVGKDPLVAALSAALGFRGVLPPLGEMIVEYLNNPLVNVEAAFDDLASGDSKALESLIEEAAGDHARVVLAGEAEYSLLKGLSYIADSGDSVSACDVDLVRSTLEFLAGRDVAVVVAGTNEAIVYEALRKALKPQGDYSDLQAMLRQNGLNIVKMPTSKGSTKSDA